MNPVAMRVPPFTIQEAKEIAASFQDLAGKEYIDDRTKRVYRILTVGVLPFFPYDKYSITHFYMGLMAKLEDCTVDRILYFIDTNQISEFDVVLKARQTENDQERLVVKPIDVIARRRGGIIGHYSSRWSCEIKK
jgi:hypothetical protein